MYKHIEELEKKRYKITQGGGDSKIKSQYSRGKLTARDRIELLLDEGSFVELNIFVEHRCTDFGLNGVEAPGEGVVTGFGTINNRTVYVFSQDFTVFGGSLSEMHAYKICQVMDLAAKNGSPIIGLNDSGGARIQEGVLSLDGYGEVFYRNAIYSGVVPQISVILGPCAGGAVYSPALTDFVFMVKGISKMFITGPKVIETVTHEKISSESLGGSEIHAAISGNSHFTCNTEEDAFNSVRKLLSFLPDNYETIAHEAASTYEGDDWREELANCVPINSTKTYDIRKVIEQILDDEDFYEVQESFAKNIVIGFGKINRRTVGIIANQPKNIAGCLDIDASDKLSRFIRTCDCFNIPLITLVDVTGFLPGVSQEHRGIIRHGAKILYAYSEATVPKISIIIRKAFGGAYVALNSKSIGADFVFAWPSAEIAVMGAEGASQIVFAKEIKESENPSLTQKEKINEYKKQFSNPYVSAAKGMIDDIIDPRETRIRLNVCLKILENKKEIRPVKKHGNIPL